MVAQQLPREAFEEGPERRRIDLRKPNALFASACQVRSEAVIPRCRIEVECAVRVAPTIIHIGAKEQPRRLEVEPSKIVNERELHGSLRLGGDERRTVQRLSTPNTLIMDPFSVLCKPERRAQKVLENSNRSAAAHDERALRLPASICRIDIGWGA